ncbi:5' exonuclease Apollo-like [Impatiens glandulifera]|uniref:5' exonuclease Apollo-like n=1 Tax=Impatiens glandulifera TaxID=253017 RepID=UPI001FB0FED1|nr:5' exonuclease Apollo-like [Impatiens glandulifera]
MNMDRGLISVDRWADGSQAYFLTHLHADHTNGLSSSWKKGPLFCSHITATIFPIKFPNFNLSLLRVLEIGRWHSISLVSPLTRSETIVNVMAIDAHHCPGAVMFLFRGDFGNMLYTGDFRWESNSERAVIGRSMLLGALKNDKLDIIYMDNTYCHPSYTFPSREVAAKEVVDIIAAHPEHDVVIAIDTLGKEELLLHIAKTLDIKIWVWPERLQIMHLLGLNDIFTTRTSLTRVRAVPRYSLSSSTLEELNILRPTIGIMPSGLPWMMEAYKGKKATWLPQPSQYSGSKLSTKDGIETNHSELNGISSGPKRYHQYIYSVPYSDHSCFSEIKEFVSLLQPVNLKGIVLKSPLYIDPLYHFGCLLEAVQPSERRQKFRRIDSESGDSVQTSTVAGKGNSTKNRIRRRAHPGCLGIRIRRVSLLRRSQSGAKIVETDV